MPAILPLLAFKVNTGTAVVGAMLVDRPRHLKTQGEPIKRVKKGDYLVIEQDGNMFPMDADAMLALFTQSPADQAALDAVLLSGKNLRDILRAHILN